jgi:hypothetical protein
MKFVKQQEGEILLLQNYAIYSNESGNGIRRRDLPYHVQA